MNVLAVRNSICAEHVLTFNFVIVERTELISKPLKI